MSNILIIKHGSLGDLIQANGAIEDIKNSFQDSKVLLLTSSSYAYLMSHCPYIDGVLIDKRLPRWNIFYLLNLKKILSKYNFSHVFDLQNSRRTNFYRKFILPNCQWSSTDTTLEPGKSKKDFDKEPVLDRMKIQLEKSGISTNKIKKINLSWSFVNIEKLIKQYTNGEYILIFPFCSKRNLNKKWPYFKDLVKELKQLYKNKYSILVAPGVDEVDEAKSLNAKVVLNENNKPINLNYLITLIEKSSFVISNDTGPAHIASHLNKKGISLFGSHTSPEKISIKSEKFKTIVNENLKKLTVNTVLGEIKKNLN